MSDNGAGIPTDRLQNIFEPDRQMELDPNREFRGIGLPMCKRILTKMGGDISVHSTLQTGTTVLIRLPYTEDVSE
ncbi:MAG: ATP-binding protein [Bacteroidota bacterium]